MSVRFLRSGAVVVTAAATLVIAGCSSSDSGSDGGSEASSSAAVESTPAPPGLGLAQKLACNPPKAVPGPASTATLKVGTLLPATGSLAFLGPPMEAGVELAIKDINAAGGVLDQPVELVTGDS